MHSPLRTLVPVVLVATALLAGCYERTGYSDDLRGPAAPGGETSVAEYGPGAFSHPAANLATEEVSRFRIGDTFFTETWSEAPGDAPERDGLGPTYLATSCAACHPADGRSSAPGTQGDNGAPLLRFVSDAADTSLDAYHVQLQTKAVPGVEAEGSLSVAWDEVTGHYADGASFSLRSPTISVDAEKFGPISDRAATGVRIGPALIGLGLLEAIPEDAIRLNADAEDVDGDGISGRVSLVESPTLGDGVLGRFGHKANVATVEDQTAIAYLLDLGITTPVFPNENCPTPQLACAAASTGGSPEISRSRFDDVVLYAQTLAVPTRPSTEDASVVEGEAVFDDLGCTACHIRRWETGEHDIEALSNQAVYPYTDLLLHDMGEGLSDGRRDGSASETEWRTAPLWGLGLARTVNQHAGFLHDGRARSIEEAILWHGGEALASRDRFASLSRANRERVLIFLKSL